MAITVATSDGVPKSVAEIVAMTDIPRSNVNRHIRALVDAGHIETTDERLYRANLKRLNTSSMSAVISEVARILHRASNDLIPFLLQSQLDH